MLRQWVKRCFLQSCCTSKTNLRWSIDSCIEREFKINFPDEKKNYDIFQCDETNNNIIDWLLIFSCIFVISLVHTYCTNIHAYCSAIITLSLAGSRIIDVNYSIQWLICTCVRYMDRNVTYAFMELAKVILSVLFSTHLKSFVYLSNELMIHKKVP